MDVFDDISAERIVKNTKESLNLTNIAIGLVINY